MSDVVKTARQHSEHPLRSVVGIGLGYAEPSQAAPEEAVVRGHCVTKTCRVHQASRSRSVWRGDAALEKAAAPRSFNLDVWLAAQERSVKARAPRLSKGAPPTRQAEE